MLNVESHSFIKPTKKVLLPADISTKWEKSKAYRDLLGFICAMNDAVTDKKCSITCFCSDIVSNLIDVLKTINGWIDDIPPLEQSQRFGNVAFRKWFEKITLESPALLSNALGDQFTNAIPEISTYFIESFGNATRIDYGTGHEISFATFLTCLYKIGALTEQDAEAVVFKIFSTYLELVWRLQDVYRMEPAGSQGVWNLDDYHFIPFIWGSSQLKNHSTIKPKSYTDQDICEAYFKDYIFLNSILRIHKVKTGPFAEHSNQLWNISGVPLWSKVNSGLIKMYKAEVLNKFPIIQHFLFGSLMCIEPVT